MNERIKELAEQANMIFNGTDLSGSIGRVQCYEDELEKFAELIVRECCDMVNKHLQHNNPNDCLLVLDIKEKFGVEE